MCPELLIFVCNIILRIDHVKTLQSILQIPVSQLFNYFHYNACCCVWIILHYISKSTHIYSRCIVGVFYKLLVVLILLGSINLIEPSR